MIRFSLILIGIVASVGAAFVAGFGVAGGFLPALAVTLVWFWYLSFGTRILSAAILGVLFEAASVLPVGTYLILFFILAGSVEILQSLVRDPRTPLIGAGSVAALFLASLALRAFVAFFLTSFLS